MTENEFRSLIADCDAATFARHSLLDESCFVFDTDTLPSKGSYTSFRSKIADHLDINPRNVAVIGSAKFGWSMSPVKFGAEYNHGESDIDIAIVSRSLYESVWQQIRRAYYNGYDVLRKDHRNEIFARFVVIHARASNVSEYLRELRKLLLDLNKVVNDFLSIEGRANYRIYSDWSDVELYHTRGVRLLKEELESADTQPAN